MFTPGWKTWRAYIERGQGDSEYAQWRMVVRKVHVCSSFQPGMSTWLFNHPAWGCRFQSCQLAMWTILLACRTLACKHRFRSITFYTMYSHFIHIAPSHNDKCSPETVIIVLLSLVHAMGLAEKQLRSRRGGLGDVACYTRTANIVVSADTVTRSCQRLLKVQQSMALRKR